jgi:NadR type nicotinamide-nucleotide adenylyltransferase
MDCFALGLVVGKFAPLHRGHELLVARAAQACERLLIVSYTKPEFDRCGVAERRSWMAARWPMHERVAVDDAWLNDACAERGIAFRAIPDNAEDDVTQQRFLAWLLRDVLQRRPDAMFCSEAYGLPCAALLTRELRHPVQAVVVDAPRAQVPISATRLRAALATRTGDTVPAHWLAPEVRASFVRRIVLLGGESSGKTTLAAALAERLAVPWVAEYGRELWDLRGGVLDEADLRAIGHEQVRREDAAALLADDLLICDTSPLTTLGYGLWMFGRLDAELERLAQRRYDAVVLCQPDIPFVQDGTRRDPGFRLHQHAWYLERLQALGLPVIEAAGALDQRLAHVAGRIVTGFASAR